MDPENQINIRPPCTCGRSATGFCAGLHRLSDEEWDARVFDEAFINEEKSQNESKSISS
jgi:hypothetical protein